MELFPYVLIRISGGSCEKLEALKLKESAYISERICYLHNEIQSVKQRLTEQLHFAISESKNSRIRILLINIKRDIYNEREVSLEEWNHVSCHLPEQWNHQIREYLSTRQEISNLLTRGENLFNKERNLVRKKFKALAQDELLQKGLLLSSQSLLNGITTYLSKDSDIPNSKDHKTELGIIKYISRMYMKTSPFSTFTNLAIAKFVTKASGNQLFPDKEIPDVLSYVRLNNDLYAYLKDLLFKNREVCRHLLLRPNPTIRLEDTQYRFLTNCGNVEAFQRVPVHAVLQLFLDEASRDKQGVAYKELVDNVRQHVDASLEEIEAYINQLIDFGFFEFNLGVSGIDPKWNEKLEEKLRFLSARMPVLEELNLVLKSLRDLITRYCSANLEARKNIQTTAYTQFRSICEKLHETAGLPELERESFKDPERFFSKKKQEAQEPTRVQEEVFRHSADAYFSFKPENMFYEETTLPVVAELDTHELDSLISTINDLLRETSLFSGIFDEQDRMLHYFLRKYGEDSSIDLLTFYEDFYREFKKPEANKDKERRQNQETEEFVPILSERNKKRKAWLETLQTLLQKQITVGIQEISLNLKDIRRVNNRIGYQPREPTSSFAAMLQLFPREVETEKGQWMAVLNGLMPGFGKMFSRFLHVFHENLTDQIRDQNESMAGVDLFLEDSDASFFNANIHPALMPFEIWMPGGQNSLPAEKQIPITELRIVANSERNSIHLIHHPSQKTVWIFDLGFQSERGRSQLFRLLAKFTKTNYPYWSGMLNAINKASQLQGKPSQIRIRPRVVFEDRIVLQRKAWLIPKELLPIRKPGDNDWTYFNIVHRWRVQNKLPEEMFIVLIEQEKLLNMKKEEQKQFSRDDYKPQFISFTNPLLLNLFEKLIHKAPGFLRMEEMLPDSKQLLQVANRRHVTEFLIQWCTHANIC